MRLSVSRIRSINRSLARVQGFTWPTHSSNDNASTAGPTHTSVPVKAIRTAKIVAVSRSVTA